MTQPLNPLGNVGMARFNNLVGNGNTKGATAPILKMLAPDQEKRLAELAPQIKNSLSHRGQALRQLLAALKRREHL